MDWRTAPKPMAMPQGTKATVTATIHTMATATVRASERPSGLVTQRAGTGIKPSWRWRLSIEKV